MGDCLNGHLPPSFPNMAAMFLNELRFPGKFSQILRIFQQRLNDDISCLLYECVPAVALLPCLWCWWYCV